MRVLHPQVQPYQMKIYNQFNQYILILLYGTATFNNLRSSGDTTTTKICIGKTCITETDLQKISSNKKSAGFATNGANIPQISPLYEGYWNIYGDIATMSNTNPFAIMGNDTWDYIYLYKGWKIQLWAAGDKGGQTVTFENKDSELPKVFNLISISGMHDTVSSYEATWVGY